MKDGGLAIVVLGGGTAGWMAACLFAEAWPWAGVTVVESPEIGIVGVGEGSTPQLRAFFRRLGIAEADWMPACNATYKTGIGFRGWSERAGFDHYFHPFATDVDPHTQPQFVANATARRRGGDVPAHPDAFFLPAWLAKHRKAPIPAESFPFDIGYGYHFDAYLVGAYLRDHAKARGVRHLARTVHTVEADAGELRALVCDDGERIAGDLFVDASGFRALLIQETLGTRFLPFASNLFNDSAVVMPTPADAAGTASATTATALSNGWCWDIPLTNRTGNGYVYSSRYCSADAAEGELRAHLGIGDDGAARHLRMKVGRVEHSWSGNCLAVGLAQGFIEPLEATALHIVQTTVEGFIDAYRDGGFTPQYRDTFNAGIARRYEGIRDYIVLHYRANQRSDTPYWRDNAGNDDLSDSLKSLITCWFTGGDLDDEIARQDIAHYYAPLSWHCLLAGYGTFPRDDRLRVPERWPVDVAKAEAFVARCGLNFRDHKAVLAELAA